MKAGAASARVFPAAAHPTFGGGSLSPDLEAAAARRLGGLALVVAVVATTMGTIELVGGMPSTLAPLPRAALMAVAVALSFALHVVIARRWVSARAALALGVVYQAAQALLSAIAFHAMALVPGVEVRGWTPVAVWILVYPLIVPGRTRRVVAASLLTAAMDPLGLWLAVAAGAPAPPAAVLGRLFLTTVLATVLVPIAAGIVYGLALEVKRAREMGSYRLVERLGKGGMGEVWRAKHRMLARPAAIKLIRPEVLGAKDPDTREMLLRRFEREAQATALMRSSHTMELYDFGMTDDGTFYYVMELLDGFDLNELVERFGPLPAERAVHMLRQVCASLAEAHEAGLIHRDVKPANLYACRYGREVDFIKVLDFGLVKQGRAPEEGADKLTAADISPGGTPAFMSPEQALGDGEVDGRSDIYALGCVAYWLLTGSLVFKGTTPMETIVLHVNREPEPPSRRTTRPVPADLEGIVLACLAKDPADRPQTADELAMRLGSVRVGEEWTPLRAKEWWDTNRPASPAGAAEPATV
jgi:eukaryotic-like serine/threonine-protein kinase